MPEMSVAFEVYCSCGNGLCNQTDVSWGPRGSSVTVTPCENCIQEAESRGHTKGYEEAQEEASESEGTS